MSYPEMWAKKQDPLGGTYVSPRDVGKKTRPARGDVSLTSDVGKKKTRPARGDVSLTSDVGKKKTRPARRDVCLTSDVGKKNKTR